MNFNFRAAKSRFFCGATRLDNVGFRGGGNDGDLGADGFVGGLVQEFSLVENGTGPKSEKHEKNQRKNAQKPRIEKAAEQQTRQSAQNQAEEPGKTQIENGKHRQTNKRCEPQKRSCYQVEPPAFHQRNSRKFRLKAFCRNLSNKG